LKARKLGSMMKSLRKIINRRSRHKNKRIWAKKCKKKLRNGDASCLVS